MQGPYADHTYAVGLAYPILRRPVNSFSLEAWVDQELAALTPAQRAGVEVSDVTVAGAPARKVLNFPAENAGKPSHRVYIWRMGNKNPRLITVTEVDRRPFDGAAMEAFLDRFASEVRP